MSDSKIKTWILENFTYPLRGKNILMTEYIRIYCDGGYPNFHYYPIFFGNPFNYEHYRLRGFSISILGREFFFIFGKDIKGLPGKLYMYTRNAWIGWLNSYNDI